MISHGDELGRSLHGNNNAYCHDTELNWLDWALAPDDLEFFEFTCEVLRIARDYRALREPRHAKGRSTAPGPVDATLEWLGADGQPLTPERLAEPELRALGLLMPSAAADSGQPGDEPLLLILNAAKAPLDFVLPSISRGGTWHRLVDTATPGNRLPTGEQLQVAPHCLLLLRYTA